MHGDFVKNNFNKSSLILIKSYEFIWFEMFEIIAIRLYLVRPGGAATTVAKSSPSLLRFVGRVEGPPACIHVRSPQW